VSSEPPPRPYERLFALSLYLGLAPLWGLFFRKSSISGFLRQHLAQATGIHFLLLLVFMVFAGVIAVISVAVIQRPEFYEGQQLEPIALTITRKLFLAWLVFLCFGVVLAMAGSRRELLLATRIGAIRAVRWFTWRVFTLFYCMVLVLVPLAYHSTQLAPRSSQGGEVVMLYEDNGIFPRWVFTLGFLPVSRAGVARFGHGSVAVHKLSEESLASAMASARFIFIGSHGGKSGLLIDGVYVPPERLLEAAAGPNLEYVYLAGCDSGTLRAGWEHAFAPAQVVTYDRLTAVAEHAWWLWRHGPDAIRRLKAS